MKFTVSTVKKARIEVVKNLDPIDIFMAAAVELLQPSNA